MIQCPYCNENIPDDSLFCDQCGKKLIFCPNCRKPGAGRMCGNCGTAMNNNIAPINPFMKQQEPAQQKPASANSQNPFIQKPVQTPIKSAAPIPDLKLKCSALPDPFHVQTGAMFGRHIHPLNNDISFDTISGNHGLFEKIKDGWAYKDTGSTNGTLHNDHRLKTNQLQTLSDGDTLTMGEVTFTIILK